jgi:hypothetical protein
VSTQQKCRSACGAHLRKAGVLRGSGGRNRAQLWDGHGRAVARVEACGEHDNSQGQHEVRSAAQASSPAARQRQYRVARPLASPANGLHAATYNGADRQTAPESFRGRSAGSADG